jgi:hypothetical protein
VRTFNYKLIEFYEGEHVELYDLAADPGEKKDLAASEPEMVEAMRGFLHRWRKLVDAQMPTPNPGYKSEGGGQ